MEARTGLAKKRPKCRGFGFELIVPPVSRSAIIAGAALAFVSNRWVIFW